MKVRTKPKRNTNAKTASTMRAERTNPRVSNPLRIDPTRTTMLRKKFIAAIRRRFAKLKLLIWELIVEQDAFGLRESPHDPFSIVEPEVLPLSVTNTTTNTRWKLQPNVEKIKAFRAWLKTQVQQQITGDDERKLWEAYAEAGFRKGQGRAFDDVRKTPIGQRTDFYNGTKDEFLRSSFGRPVAVEKIQLLAGRSFTDLEGVTEQMSTAMTRTLTDGLTQGKNPRDIADDLEENVDGIGRQRAQAIAQTEIIRAHAEGQLDAMEQLGVEEVGVSVEWSTAGDDRVCFPAWTLVETDTGFEPIQSIKVGTLVKTRKGLKKVTGVSVLKAQELTIISTDTQDIVATPDHPIWVSGIGWVVAQEIANVDGCLNSVKDETIKVVGSRNINFGDSTNIDTDTLKELGFLGVFDGITMPVGSINFDSDAMLDEVEVGRVSCDLKLLDVSNLKCVESQSDGLFNRCFAGELPVATESAETPLIVAGASAEVFAASSTGGVDRGAATKFGTVVPIVPARLVGPAMVEDFTAGLTGTVLATLMLETTRDGTVIVSVRNAPLDTEVYTTPTTQFGNRFAGTLFLIASPRTESSIGSIGTIDGDIADGARNVTPCLVRLGVAFVGAEPLDTVILSCLRRALESLSTMVTVEYERHFSELLCKIGVLYHLLSSIQPKIYDLQVQDEHEFYANKILVHNCQLCSVMEGVVLKLDEARGMIPRHVSCRCSFTPAGVGEDDSNQVDTKKGIDKSIKKSQALEGEPNEGEEGGSWGPGESIDRDRPRSIINEINTNDDPLLWFSNAVQNANDFFRTCERDDKGHCSSDGDSNGGNQSGTGTNKGKNSTTLSDGTGITFVPHPNQRPDETTVMLDVKTLDMVFSKETSYLPKDRVGESEVKGRREGVTSFLKKGTPIQASRGGLGVDGSWDFEDGRHRFAVLRDRGAKQIAVTIPKEQKKEILKKFGKKKDA